jgi:hypothetical protein
MTWLMLLCPMNQVTAALSKPLLFLLYLWPGSWLLCP